jgi:hypothetical protein
MIFMLLFVGAWVGQIAFGLHEHNGFLQKHGEPKIEWTNYLSSGHFFN